MRSHEEKIIRLTQEIEHLSNFIKVKGDEMDKLRTRNQALESAAAQAAADAVAARESGARDSQQLRESAAREA